MSKVAIIVPVYNAQSTLSATLDSIEKSIWQALKYFSDVAYEIVVILDAPTDQSEKIVSARTQSSSFYKVVKLASNQGYCKARNRGIDATDAEILMFCDADDLFFDLHVTLHTFAMLNRSKQLEIRGANGSASTLCKADFAPGLVKTTVYMRDTVHTKWKEAIFCTLMLCTSIRREVWDFIEGIPEHSVFRRYGCEDIAVMRQIFPFFKTCSIPVDTCEYVRRPGNFLDRQLKKFQRHPDEDVFEPIDEHHADFLRWREDFEETRVQYLENKLKWRKYSAAMRPYLSDAIVTRFSVA